MKYEDVLTEAKKTIGKCNVCPVCDGRACAGRMPGPGGKGSGSTNIRNYTWWRDSIKLNMDVLGEAFEPDISTELFGIDLKMPIMAAPIGMIAFNFSDALNEYTYAKAVVNGTNAAGTLAFTGGGAVDECFFDPLKAIKEIGVPAIPTLKPWRMELVEERIKIAEESGAIAIAMDIDSAGLPHSSASAEPMIAKSASDIAQIVKMTALPFIVKGIMTKDAARAAVEAGAYGIVVSNHGGRVLDEGLATGEVLSEIKDVVGNRGKILVDGGIRTGVDVCKAITLGADGVLIGRPCTIAAFGGGEEGISLYFQRLAGEMKDAMKMIGAKDLKELDSGKIKNICDYKP